MVEQRGCRSSRVMTRAVVDPIGSRGMLPQCPRPPLRVPVAGTARQATFRPKPCQTARRDHIDQTQGPPEANLGQPRTLQLTVGYKPRLQSSTANGFHKGAILVPSKVKDAEIAVGRVPSMTLAASEENGGIANSVAPVPEICRRRQMNQRLPVIQVGRRWMEHEVVYPPCSP
jgi:hypothetical protein